MIKKIFLKYNKDPKENPSSLRCLDFWLSVFADRDVYIICDMFDPTLKFPKQFTDYSSCKFINSNYDCVETDSNYVLYKLKKTAYIIRP